MAQLCSHLSIQSRHLFLLCLHHPVITSGSFPSSISRTSIQSLCDPALPYHTTSTFFMSYLSPSSRHPSPRLSLPAAACHRLNSFAQQPHQSDIFVAPLTPWLLVQLQLYMVPIARPFPAFMHRVSLLMCFRVCLAFSLRCVCFDRTLLLHNSDPSPIRNTLPLAT